jgi:hypothetical protein
VAVPPSLFAFSVVLANADPTWTDKEVLGAIGLTIVGIVATVLIVLFWVRHRAWRKSPPHDRVEDSNRSDLLAEERALLGHLRQEFERLVSLGAQQGAQRRVELRQFEAQQADLERLRHEQVLQLEQQRGLIGRLLEEHRTQLERQTQLLRSLQQLAEQLSQARSDRSEPLIQQIEEQRAQIEELQAALVSRQEALDRALTESGQAVNYDAIRRLWHASRQAESPEDPIHPPRAPAGSADSVDCAVFAPSEVRRGEDVLVQAFAFHTGHEREAATQAVGFDPTAGKRGSTTLNLCLSAGQFLTFHLTLRGADVLEPVKDLVWRRRTDHVTFVVEIPKDRTPGTLIGTLVVSVGGIPVGQINFKLTVVRGAEWRTTTGASVSIGESATRFRRAFVSYASADRAEVVRRVQMLRQPVTDIEVFQDVLDLAPGEEFEPTLFERIDQCDLFLLFWSSSAQNSEWVRREWEHALRRQGAERRSPPTIFPVVIEGPPPPTPPPELAHLHFNDYLLYLIR